MTAGAGEAPVDVLVVGAGPTGLTLALQAHAHGARVRVVEIRPQSFRPSRAMIVHPRTLEVLRPLGVADELLAHGDAHPSARLHLGTRVVPVELTDFALPDTAFPHLLLARQHDVETVLAAALAERGVAVERGTALESFAPADGMVTAQLARDGTRASARARFLAGCDGAASTVRTAAGIGSSGAPYSRDVVLADLELDADLAHGVAHVVAGRGGLVFLFALGEGATWRLLATQASGGSQGPFGSPGPPVPAERLQALLDDAGLPARITDVPWSGLVRLQHRVATRYRDGAVFLAGDAAHTHSPAGGQGMNTGIQDAVNLGWKLAYAARSGRACDDPVLLSYELERRPVARQILALTHAIFWAESGTDPVASFVRGALAPLAAPLVPVVMRQRRMVAEGIRILSQLRWHYRRSPLSVEAAPRAGVGAHAGDRLPDATVLADGRVVRLHELTAGPGVRVLLERDAPGLPEVGSRAVVQRVDSWPGAGVVVVRPDGYVGYRCARTDPAAVRRWLDLAAVP